jgi:hypothetical protein
MDFYNGFIQLTEHPTAGTALGLTAYFVMTRAIPWIWDRVSKTRQDLRDKEKHEKQETRKDVKEIKSHLITLNGHTKDEMIHVPRLEIYKRFDKVDEQGREILTILAKKGVNEA